MFLDLCKIIIITTLGWVNIGLAASAKLPTDRQVQEAIKDIKIEELDINGNGKPDYFREFDEQGRLKFIRYDYNEDGKPEFQIELDENGFKKAEFVDRNYDGKIDYKVVCTKKDCTKYIDVNFDGKFVNDGKIPAERYAQAGKAVDEFRIFLEYKTIFRTK